MKMTLRPYQEDAKKAVLKEWQEGIQKTLLVLVTGGGKTIVFSKIIETLIEQGERVLVLAHRGELLDQAKDKLYKATGLKCATEKAEESCLKSWFRVVVGSIQSLQREKRLQAFPHDYFDTIIIDEAHHALSDGYMRVLQYFDSAKVLGVTATPDRGDMKNLGQIFQSLAYEYSLPQAIRDGYLCKIKAMTIPIQIDMTGVKIQQGDYALNDVGTTLEPYLEQIACEMKNHAEGRKIVVFLPLIKTSQKMCMYLNKAGFHAAEVNGESVNRAEILSDFEQGKYNVLCNSMLLTEGWDCPSVDCIVVLRPTKVRSLYVQMVGRGTRLSEGKESLLLLDFLWNTTRHELCRPACLVAESADVQDKMVEKLNDAPYVQTELEVLKEESESDVVKQREESLANQLHEMRKRKRALVDPLQYEMSIQAEDLSSYVPSFGWEMAPPSDKQKEVLEKYGIMPDEIENAGKAKLILDRLNKRREEGLTTPKQIRFLESRGFSHVGTWAFNDAKQMIDRIAMMGWKIPINVDPMHYKPGEESNA